MEKLKLVAIRHQLGYTQKEMAEKLEMDYQRYQKIENGTRKIRGEELIKIGNFANIPVEKIQF